MKSIEPKHHESFFKKKDHTLAVRLDAPSLERLNAMAVQWQVSRGEVLRRLLKMVS